MLLHWSPISPFVRKVMIAAHELALVERIERRRSVARMTAPNAALMEDNPLSKIPTLVLEDGTVLIDSVVICEYFDSLAGGGRIIPRAGMARWLELSRHVLANGLLDVLILWRNERDKPAATQTPLLLESFRTKTAATLARLERDIPAIADTPFGIAQITLGCCLSYLDFRFAEVAWRDDHPGLAAWHVGFCARPSAQATEIVNG
jgi:glutathione S-transferase